MLVISCKKNDNCDSDVNDTSTMIGTKSITAVESDNDKECTSIININQELCLDCDMDAFKKIFMLAVYPQFYEQWMISNKEHSEVETHFIKENWLTDELTQELEFFRPNLRVHTTQNDKFESMCRHLFPLGRKFANYRQLDQYINVFLESWKCVKHRDGNSFRCFFAKSKKSVVRIKQILKGDII